MMFAKVDVTVNIFCFYIRFAFSAADYKRCCKFVDYCLKVNMKRSAVVGITMQMAVQTSLRSEASTIK